MVISIKEKKTITISQEVGNREISSGLEKLKSLQKKITDEPELLSKFISENLDTSYNFESLKSNREESNRSIIYNKKALYHIDTKPIIDFFIENIDVAAKVADLLLNGEIPFIVDHQKTSFIIQNSPTIYFPERYTATIKNLCIVETESYDNFLSLIGKENMYIYKELVINHLNKESLFGHYLIDGKVPEQNVYNLNNVMKLDLMELVECGTKFNSEPFLKVYFSLEDNWISLTKQKDSDSILLVEIKYSTMLTSLFSKSVFNLDKNLFYDFVKNRILNGLQTKIKNLSKNKLTLRQVLKKEVSLTLLSDEQIRESLPEGANQKFFKALNKVVKDKQQINRVFNVIENKLLDFHNEVLKK